MMGTYRELPDHYVVGSRVCHVKDSTLIGVITQIEDNRLSVMVLWDDCDGEDFQWANKVTLMQNPNDS